ncbi:MAG: CsgG/HfaB family protein [Gemmatimonadota bacterium]
MRFLRVIPLAAVGGLLLGACGGTPAPGTVAPADLPALEAERARHPADPSVLTRIGIAYYNAKDYTRAQDALRGALAVEKGNYPATVYLGLSQEAAGNLAGARASYNTAGTLARNPAEKGEVRGLLTLLTRKDLEQAAREAVARESELSKQPPTENTIAVFPFRYLGTNPDFKPLESGLTYLVVTDLSKVNRLTLLERARVQNLVDEMKLTESGKTDPASGARSGRMLRAASVVQGTLQNGSSADRLKLDASVVATTSSTVVANGSANDDLKKLFDMEKQVVFQLLRKMNIQLTPAEQRAISERPTADLQAFLAFSNGLEAEDRGDFKAAGDAYGRAAARDPNFRAAKEHQAAVVELSGLGVSAPVALSNLGGPNVSPGDRNPPTSTGDLLHNLIGGTVPGTGHQIEIATRPPDERHNLPEVNGGGVTDPPSLTGTIIIIITRP